MISAKKYAICLVSIILIIMIGGEAMAIEKPWEDWPDTDIEAGFWLKEKGYLQGFVDGTFRPHVEVTPFQFSLVLDRVGIESKWPEKIDIGEALKYLPNTVQSSKSTDTLTRYRYAVMLYRHFNGIHFPAPVTPDQEVIDRLELFFKDKKVTWDGVTRTPRLAGHAELIVSLSRETGIPIWLALGQCWRESQWFTTGLSTRYNCGWGIKDREGRWGTLGSPNIVSGFSNYISVEEAIRAYFNLMSSPERPYKALIEKGDDVSIRTALNTYAPAYENDTWQHWIIVKTVRSWCNERGIR